MAMDALSQDFDLLTVLCGINDIGFRRRLSIGNSIEKFAFVYDALLHEAKEPHPNARFILMSPFPLIMHTCNSEFRDDNFANYDHWKSEIENEAEITANLASKYSGIIFHSWISLQSTASYTQQIKSLTIVFT